MTVIRGAKSGLNSFELTCGASLQREKERKAADFELGERNSNSSTCKQA